MTGEADFKKIYNTYILLSEIEGFSNREIADILHVSLDAVKISLHRARAILKILDEACDIYHNEQDIPACGRKSSIINIRKTD